MKDATTLVPATLATDFMNIEDNRTLVIVGIAVQTTVFGLIALVYWLSRARTKTANGKKSAKTSKPPTKYKCRACRKVMKVPKGMYGFWVVCPNCRKIIRIPKVSGVTPPEKPPVRDGRLRRLIRRYNGKHPWKVHDAIIEYCADDPEACAEFCNWSSDFWHRNDKAFAARVFQLNSALMPKDHPVVARMQEEEKERKHEVRLRHAKCRFEGHVWESTVRRSRPSSPIDVFDQLAAESGMDDDERPSYRKCVRCGTVEKIED